LQANELNTEIISLKKVNHLLNKTFLYKHTAFNLSSIELSITDNNWTHFVERYHLEP